MNRKIVLFIALLFLTALSIVTFTGCAKVRAFLDPNFQAQPASEASLKLQSGFAPSGTIVLSREMPRELSEPNDTVASKLMAPLVGFAPPSVGFLPANNEAWLEINKDSQLLTLYQGKEVVRAIHAEGKVNLKPGNYPLEQKQKSPVWYARDGYFTKRRLTVPSADDPLRYLRGALGSYALYLNTSFPIHSAAIWSEDVGGLRLAQAELETIYDVLPIGATIVVK